MGKWGLQEKKALSVAFASFYGVNSPTMASFKVSVVASLKEELGRDRHIQHTTEECFLGPLFPCS